MPNHVLKHESKILQALLSKLEELHQYNTLLTQHLAPEIVNYCQVVNYDRNCLIVIVENGSWATQLRFQIPDLIMQLRQYQLFANLSGIICKIRPNPAHIKSNKKSARSITPLSQQTAETVMETAKTIRDNKLRKILEKIAQN